MEKEKLKQEVFFYWNQASCGTDTTKKEKFSREYFEEIESVRYAQEPEIFSFAQFTRYRDKKVLEVGVGAGSDFLQWNRAGAHAHGIDLTQEAIDNVSHRLKTYNLQAADLQVADAENLPYQDNFFDCVYSWGVIHHSPDTEKCLQEIIRVTKPGGHIKIMVYNRYSILMLYKYLLYGVFSGKPFQTFSSILWNHQESKGTKAYSFKEIKKMVSLYPVKLISLNAPVTIYDLYRFKKGFKASILQIISYFLAFLGGWSSVGWFLCFELEKITTE